MENIKIIWYSEFMNFIYLLPVVTITYFAACYWYPQNNLNIDTVYLSMSIFLFATLSGFFISRQSARYEQVVLLVSQFDGIMTSLYRTSQLVSVSAHDEARDVVRAHYDRIMTASNWQAYVNQKSDTITRITALLQQIQSDNKELTDLQREFVARSGFNTIVELQKIRKNMIVLFNERIPRFQWALMAMLALVLLAAVFVVPTMGDVFSNIIKSAFATVIVAVLILLQRLNNFTLFEEMAGRSSAQDVLDIIEGVK